MQCTEDFSISGVLFVAPTGRAVHNIHSCTIHHAFMIAVDHQLGKQSTF